MNLRKSSIFVLASTLLFTSYAFAEKVVVVPLGGEKATGTAVEADVVAGKTFSSDAGIDLTGTLTVTGPTCGGTLNGTRWCDNGDGTVLDMTTGLVWLKNASCMGTKPWIKSDDWNDAQTAAGTLETGNVPCNLTDGSTIYDWRLPTYDELKDLALGVEQVRATTPRAFSNVASAQYWSSTSYAPNPGWAWLMHLGDGGTGLLAKDSQLNVWPVRAYK